MRERSQIFSELQTIDNLPTLPLVIDELGRAIRDPSSDARKVAKIIEDDPAIMARILKVVNSAFYSGTMPVTSVHDAVARMGMRAINNVAISTAVFSAFGESLGGDFDREEFWRHSISCGIGSIVVYERSCENLERRYGKDVLHLAGLLHDVGKIIFDQFFHEEFVEALKLSRDESISLAEAEERTIGANHAEVGAWFGLRWNLSPELLQVIRWHHDPESSDAENREFAEIVHTADYICNQENIGFSGNSTPTYQNYVWKRLGLTIADIPDVVDEVKACAEESEILMAFV